MALPACQGYALRLRDIGDMWGLYRDYVGLYRGYIRNIHGIFWRCTEIVEKRMETTILGFRTRVI